MSKKIATPTTQARNSVAVNGKAINTHYCFSGSLNKIKRRIIRQKWVLIALLIFAVLLNIIKEPISQRYGIYLALSDCLPYKVYFFDKQQKINKLKVGDIIAGRAVKMEPVLKDGETIAKMVIGVPGDKVEIKDGKLTINGHYWANTDYATQKHGKSKNHYDTSYTIKDGELFLYGTAQNSYDSRYWGTYPQDNVYGIVRPLF